MDLDGDGVEADALAHFDHEGDGWNELTRWAGEDDGVLVWDKNKDGAISDGSELFGNNAVLGGGGKAAHGFAALAELDSNHDGVVDAQDAKWSELRVMRWSDANDDGIVQDGEKSLVTLESLGVKSLATGFANSDHVDASGNEHRQVGSYTKADGSTATMTDVWFVTSPGMTTYDDSGIPEHSKAIAALPDIAGGGRVYSLRDAMALDEAAGADGASLLRSPYGYKALARAETRSLREMVEGFMAADADGNAALDKAQRTALAEKILLRWSGAEGVTAKNYWYRFSSFSVDTSYTTPEKLAAVEAFQGEMWLKGSDYRNPAYSTAQKVNRGYLNHVERLYANLMMESHLSDLRDAMGFSLKDGATEDSTDADDYELDFGAAAKILAGEGNARRSEWLRSLAALFGNSEVVAAGIKKSAAAWQYEYEFYADYLERAVFDGSTARQNDFVGDCGCSGGLRDNVFWTTDGGSDRLEGRGGNDTYYLGYGSGHDRIQEIWRDSDFAGDSGDAIRVAPGIATAQVKLARTRDDLIVTLHSPDGAISSSLTVERHFSDAAARVEKVTFADGTVWDSAALQATTFSSGQGSAGADTYDGGLDGKNLVLRGGKGSDTYLLGRDSGNDTVNEALYNTHGNADTDVVRLKKGLSAADVRLRRNKNDLTVEVLSADGSTVASTLTIGSYYIRDAARIERVELADGTLLWDADDLAAAVYADASGGSEVIGGSSGSDAFSGFKGGNDIFRGGGGADVYWFGSGSGHDIVDEGVRNFGSAGDTVRLSAGIAAADVSLSRSQYDLKINLKDSAGKVTDSLTVKNHYASDIARIERVELADGTLLWDADDFAAAVYADAGSGSETMNGSSGGDAFSGFNGGNDTFRGGGGADVYWLGAGSGHDIVDEGRRNFGSAGDTVRLGAGIAASDVSLARGKFDLIINLKDSAGKVTDSLTVKNHYVSDAAKIERVELSDGTLLWGKSDFASVSWDAPTYASGNGEITGGAGNDYFLYGKDDLNDVFDTDAGGNDRLYGYGGDDVYWLGAGTGHDAIHEYSGNSGDAGDVIKIKSGIAVSSVRLRRSHDGYHLHVMLLDSKGAVTDSLTVANHYTNDSAKIERIEFADGKKTVWDAGDFAQAEITGGAGDDHFLYGKDDLNDVFDTDAGGNDRLYGYGGDDVYWLGAGTGHDAIHEYSGNSGDASDVIKVKSGIAVSSVRLRRSNDGYHLDVQLLDSKGVVTDSLRVVNHYTDASARVERLEFADSKTVWDASDFALVEIAGGAGDDRFLYGRDDLNDVFDADAGGNDRLHGYGGDDVYWLGAGTGHDSIYEYHSNSGDASDVIKVKSGIAVSNVRLRRSNDGCHLHVQLLDGKGAVTDSLRVAKHYTDDSAKIERLEFADGNTVWNARDFALAEIAGGAGKDNLYGQGDMNDVFDSDAGGNDRLHGYGGDDVYWLGAGTGRDEIHEYLYNSSGDAGDAIKIKSGIAMSSVRLRRSDDGYHLDVQILDGKGIVTDSLRVVKYYTDVSAKVERVKFAGSETVWDANDFALAAIVGGASNDNLYGRGDLNDVFDADAGGNDRLHGYGGDDVYWLGAGTGHDSIYEYHSNSGDGGDVIKVKSGIAASSVRLRRSDDGYHLHVQLLDSKGAVTDSLRVAKHYTDMSARVERLEFAGSETVWDANDFALAEIVGGASNDNLYGRGDLSDVFDADAGGNDRLYGYGGDDVYWLGAGTGHDAIHEYSGNSGDGGDVIKVKSGIAVSSVRLRRSDDGYHLHVQLLDSKGKVTDSLGVAHHFTDASAKVERIEFSDSKNTVWDADDFALAEIVGGTGNDNLYGRGNLDDVFDADAGGNDRLYGYGGDDVYWLGAGTGRDEIHEYYGNGGDSGDVIKVKSGIAVSSVRLRRSDDGYHLHVELLDSKGKVTDSLGVAHHFTDASAKVERIEADGKVLLESKFQQLIDEINAFNGNTSSFSSASQIYDHYWADSNTLSLPG